MEEFKSKITPYAISFARYIVAMRAKKLNWLEYIAVQLCVLAKVDLLIFFMWTGVIGKRIAPWTMYEHSMSENYEDADGNPCTYCIYNADLYPVAEGTGATIPARNVAVELAWLGRYTDLSLSSFKKLLSLQDPSTTYGKMHIKFAPTTPEKNGKVQTLIVDLAKETWFIKGVTEEETVMFDSFPLFTEQ
jgi:hypothetical protein